MKFTTTLISTLAAIATTVSADNTCVKQEHGTYTYIVTTDRSYQDISGTCGGLWDNLKQFSACSASDTSCGVVGQNNVLQWQFTTTSSCNSGMVEATWWDATKNKFGSISC